jgi:hypothetical protein
MVEGEDHFQVNTLATELADSVRASFGQR